MSRIFITFISVAMIFFCCGFKSQNEECMDLFNKAFGKMTDMSPSLTKGLSLKYAVTAETLEGETYSDNIDLNILNDKASIVSTDVTIFQDEKTMVTIRPESTTIFMTKPGDKNFRKAKFQDIMKLQDSIFSKMILKNCTAEGTGLKKMTFVFPQQVMDRIGISSANYWVDEKKVTIKKLQLIYANQEGQRLKKWSMEFLHVDTRYAQLPFQGSALGKIYDSKNTLRPLYKNYAVIDKR